MYSDQAFTDIALVKWGRGERLSREDMLRVLTVLEERPLQFSIINEQEAAGLKARLQHVLRKNYLGD